MSRNETDIDAHAQRASEDAAASATSPDDTASEQPLKSPAKARSAGKRKSGEGLTKSADVGQLLRNAYSQTMEEAVPDDLMDLLNKLE